MQLNLGGSIGGYSPEHQESLVIHFFGHALGLENEHQRPEFWNALGKYLDVKKMKANPRVGSNFEDQWAEKEAVELPVNCLLEYDPDSIMHYRLALKFSVDHETRIVLWACKRYLCGFPFEIIAHDGLTSSVRSILLASSKGYINTLK